MYEQEEYFSEIPQPPLRVVDEKRISFIEAQEVATICYRIDYHSYIALKIRQHIMRVTGDVNPSRETIKDYLDYINLLLTNDIRTTIPSKIAPIIDDIRHDYMNCISRRISFNNVPRIKEYDEYVSRGRPSTRYVSRR